jgi:hypothetical protein
MPFGERGNSVTAANPIIVDGHVFLTASYGVGAVFARFGKDKVETVWADNNTMSCQYVTCVRHEGHLYGIDGRQDQGTARLRCFDPRTQRVQWTEEDFGMGSLLLADGKLVIFKDDGTLILAAASPAAYREMGRVAIMATETRPLPALAGGLLYVRDKETLKCVDLRRKANQGR